MPRRTSRRIPAVITLIAAAGLVVTVGAAPGAGAAGSVSFSATYVSKTLGGGEPFVIYSHAKHDLIFSAHESTTLLNRNGLTSPGSSCDFQTGTGYLCSYNNEVNVWYSTDQGKTWQTSALNPLYLGFSDPSLTEDAGGRIYDTGIDLANDALFSTDDGGRNFSTGTPQCHDGDRPWLAGGQPNEVFLSTDTVEGPTSGHEIFHSSDGGASCDQTGIADTGDAGNGLSYSGYGQLYYNHQNGTLIEPADWYDSNSVVHGVGISTLANASHAWTGSGTFVPHEAAKNTTQLGHWPAIAIDNGGTTYLVWDTNARNATSKSGCDTRIPNAIGGPALQANSVMLAYTRDGGKTWSGPYTVAHPGTTVLWPWVVAGSPGHIAVSWYQGDQLTDPDCDSAALASGGHPTKWTIRAALIPTATSASSYPTSSINVVPTDAKHPGGVFHVGGICQGGTTCFVTGQDRRLGDYFTNAIDAAGCLMIATGDTMLTDSTTGGDFAQSRPLFIRQTSGTSLTGQSCAAPTTSVAAVKRTAAASAPSRGLANTGEPGSIAVIALLAVATGGAIALTRSLARR